MYRYGRRTKTRQRTKRCICGLPMPHPPIAPGAPWDWNPAARKGMPDYLKERIERIGHIAHEPTEHCHCAFCDNFR
jgi:hypothetical protein